MSIEMEGYAIEIRQVVPAPGWRVVSCYLSGEEPYFEDLPVVGWAVIHHTPRSPEMELLHDSMELLVGDQDGATFIEYTNEHNSDHCIVHLLPPLTELDEDLQVDLGNKARAKLARAVKAKAVSR